MNNDLISREALRNVILNDRKLDGANANWEVNRILVHIDNAPTVESLKDITELHCDITKEQLLNALRPQGKWKFSQGVTTQGSLKCPFCDYRDYHNTNSNFCPNCGADMRGEENG